MIVWIAAQAATIPDLMLSCPGQSSGYVQTRRDDVAASDNSGNTAVATGSTREMTTVEGTTDFRILNGAAEVQIPHALLPALAGGKAGWFKVKDLVVTDLEITGKVSIQWLSSSKFRIDRVTGILTTSGGFRGKCHAVDPTQRAF